MCIRDRHRACLLRLAASLAALRLVYKAFLSIALLLAGRENEFLMAVFADEMCIRDSRKGYVRLEKLSEREATSQKLLLDREEEVW